MLRTLMREYYQAKEAAMDKQSPILYNESMSQEKQELVGIMPGGFNLLHAGHLEALKYASRYCGWLAVVLVRDQSVRGHKLYQEPIEDRYLKLKAVRYVDEIIPCENEASLLELLKLIDYDLYFLSEEYKGSFEEGKKIIGEDRLVYVPRKHNRSTTDEVNRIRNG